MGFLIATPSGQYTRENYDEEDNLPKWRAAIQAQALQTGVLLITASCVSTLGTLHSITLDITIDDARALITSLESEIMKGKL